MKKHLLVKYEIEGLNLTRLLNFLSEKNIEFYNLNRINTEKVSFEIDKKYRKLLLKYVDDKKFNIKEIKISKAEKLKNFAFKYMYLIVSAIFCIASFFVLKIYVLQTEINGASTALKQDIVKILDENNVGSFSLKSNIDVKKIESAIKDRLEKVSLCSVNFKGLTLVVNVKEKDEQAGLAKRENIVASYSGQIKSINLVSGTLMVTKGQFVKEGDILIKGESIVNGEVQKVNPIGQIEIVAFYTASKVYNEYEDTMVRTGEKYVLKYWTIFNNKVKLNIRKSSLCPYTYFETETKLVNKSVFPIIPVKSYETVYYETKMQKIYKSFLDNEAEILNEVVQQAKEESGFLGEFIASSSEYVRLAPYVYHLKGHVQFLVTCK